MARCDYVVAQDGSGDFTTIQEAVDAAKHRGRRTTILIRADTYCENPIDIDGVPPGTELHSASSRKRR